jgi:hypothetical protein
VADRLRRAHFPPERNFLAAHVTLFHALPPFAEEEARALLARVCADHAPPEARLSGVMDLGKGTAFAIECAPLLALRDDIAEHFHGLLTAQDSHRPRLHVTVQNKVERAAARSLQTALEAGSTRARSVSQGWRCTVTGAVRGGRRAVLLPRARAMKRYGNTGPETCSTPCFPC